jgi:hypothetical protein
VGKNDERQKKLRDQRDPARAAVTKLQKQRRDLKRIVAAATPEDADLVEHAQRYIEAGQAIEDEWARRQLERKEATRQAAEDARAKAEAARLEAERAAQAAQESR